MTSIEERREQIVDHADLTGIDFVDVERSAPPVLRVHFLNDNPPVPVSEEDVSVESLRPEADVRTIPVESVSWNGGVLEVTVATRGDFTPYILRIDPDAVAEIDRRFSEKPFRFQAVCDRDVDCRQPEAGSRSEAEVDFPVDYMARDFESFRRALLEFAAQRYPEWGEANAADQVVMLTEVMSTLGDDFAYYQDQIAREGYLETASQRRSIRRLARLVDYAPHPGRAASTWLWLEVDEPGAGDPPLWTVEGGAPLRGRLRPGADAPYTFDEVVDFEVGASFEDIRTRTDYKLDPARNQLEVHLWDGADAVLESGSTQLSLKGDQRAALGLSGSGAVDEQPARWVLLCDEPENASEIRFCWPVRVVEAVTEPDRLTGETTTRIRWDEAGALPRALDLEDLVVRGNVLRARAGTTFRTRFVIGDSSEAGDLPSAVERVGPDGATIYRFTLPGSAARPLAWGARDGCLCPHVDLRSVYLPELEDVGPDVDGEIDFEAGQHWSPRRSFVRGPSADRYSRSFVLEAGSYGEIDSHVENGREHVHVDYAADEGYTIRFGDGDLGRVPPQGTVFEVTYRLGNGSGYNVAEHTLTELAPPGTTPTSEWEEEGDTYGFEQQLGHPLPAEGGEDEESPAEIRRDAPRAYRHEPLRAVRPGDYAAAAERLDWVDRAGAEFRWTGSWTTAFVTPDPEGAVQLSQPREAELEDHLDAVRQAGRPVEVSDPVYADLDLRIHICVAAMARRSRVRRAVDEALFGSETGAGPSGFFHPDRFEFGDALERAALEARLQGVEGVKAVEEIWVRRRGWFGWRELEAFRLEVGDDEIIRVANDPVFPGRGTVELELEGGR